MPDFPKELEDTDKLLYLTDLGGVSQAPLMKELAQAAQELYKEYPEFCALIPFGSRTKWLSRGWQSDLDIFLVLKKPASWYLLDNNNFRRSDDIRHALESKLWIKGIKYDVLIKGEDDYSFSLWAIGILGVDVFMLWTILGPHRLWEAQEIARRSSEWMKIETKARILRFLKTREGDQSKRKLPEEIIQNRLRLWEKRITSLLHMKKED